jgi:catalase (peroxidase I)
VRTCSKVSNASAVKGLSSKNPCSASHRGTFDERGDEVRYADNGSPMKGATMLATLQTLGVMPSYQPVHRAFAIHSAQCFNRFALAICHHINGDVFRLNSPS